MDFKEELANKMDEFISSHIINFDKYAIDLKEKISTLEYDKIDLDLACKIVQKRETLELALYKKYTSDMLENTNSLIHELTEETVVLILENLEKVERGEKYVDDKYSRKYILELVKRSDDQERIKLLICKIAYRQVKENYKKKSLLVIRDRYKFFKTQINLKAINLSYEIREIYKAKREDLVLVEPTIEDTVDIIFEDVLLTEKLALQNDTIEELLEDVIDDLIETPDQQDFTISLEVDEKSEDNQTLQNVDIGLDDVHASLDKLDRENLIYTKELSEVDQAMQIASEIENVNVVMDQPDTTSMPTVQDLEEFFDELKAAKIKAAEATINLNNHLNQQKELKKEKSIARKIIETSIESLILILIFFGMLYLVLDKF